MARHLQFECRKKIFKTNVQLKSLLLKFILYLSLFLFLGVSSVAPLCAQELPDNSIWRFGDSGDDSKDNGYYRLVFSPNGKYLAARNRSNFLEIYNIETKKQLCQVEGDDSLINTIHFSPDSKSFLTCCTGDGEKIRIWSTQTGALEKEISVESAFAYFLDDGQRVVTTSDGQEVDTFDWRESKLVNQKKSSDRGRLLAMSQDGSQLAVSRALRNRLYQIHVIDLESKSKTILDGPTELTKRVEISPNGLWLAASYSRRDPNLRLWDLRNPHEDKFILKGHKATIQSIAFSSDGRFLVSSSWDQTVIVWDLLTKEKIVQFTGHTENVNSVAFNSIDLTVASGASGRTDSSILLWDLKPVIFAGGEFPDSYESFEVVWKELGSAFPDQAFLAMQAMTQKDEKWLNSISRKIGVATRTVSPAEISQWIEQLNSRKYKLRKEATEKLMEARRSAEPMLRETLANPPSTEVEYRILKILKQPVKRPKINFSELRRLHRSIFVLEMIGTELAQSILKDIAIGHPNIDVADDAKDSLKRVRQKTSNSNN